MTQPHWKCNDPRAPPMPNVSSNFKRWEQSPLQETLCLGFDNNIPTFLSREHSPATINCFWGLIRIQMVCGLSVGIPWQFGIRYSYKVADLCHSYVTRWTATDALYLPVRVYILLCIYLVYLLPSVAKSRQNPSSGLEIVPTVYAKRLTKYQSAIRKTSNEPTIRKSHVKSCYENRLFIIWLCDNR